MYVCLCGFPKNKNKKKRLKIEIGSLRERSYNKCCSTQLKKIMLAFTWIVSSNMKKSEGKTKTINIIFMWFCLVRYFLLKQKTRLIEEKKSPNAKISRFFLQVSRRTILLLWQHRDGNNGIKRICRLMRTLFRHVSEVWQSLHFLK